MIGKNKVSIKVPKVVDKIFGVGYYVHTLITTGANNMRTSSAFSKGMEIKRLGKSIEFNPYRHKGTAQEFEDFVKGYNA